MLKLDRIEGNKTFGTLACGNELFDRCTATMDTGKGKVILGFKNRHPFYKI